MRDIEGTLILVQIPERLRRQTALDGDVDLFKNLAVLPLGLGQLLDQFVIGELAQRLLGEQILNGERNASFRR